MTVALCLCADEDASQPEAAAVINRSSFPEGFLFGAASSAYQYEGAATEGGKGPSIWDTFTHQHPDKIVDRSNGDVANDSYHRYKEDVSLMKDMGMDAYRFSISWPRILPSGSLSGGINREGVLYYNNLINELLSKGLQPFVTLFHWDLPQALEDKYLGFLSPTIIEDYLDFVEVCFEEFGDRVKHWITFNEPYIFILLGYAMGLAAPSRCSSWQAGKCSVGNSGTEPYIVMHHQILAHAAAVKLYRDKYQMMQNGKVGIALPVNWQVPYDPDSTDDAVQRQLDFHFGWSIDPLVFGEYPRTMQELVGDRLPKFTEEESNMVKGSFDFIGINYYTAFYAETAPAPDSLQPDYTTDSRTTTTGFRDGEAIGAPQTGIGFYVYPAGLREALLYTKRKYNNPVIYITENGFGEFNRKKSPLSLEEALKDDDRISFYSKHLLSLQLAIKEGVNVRGFFAWSLLDNFEWASGYTNLFGLVYVDRDDGLRRYPKKSALWFQDFLKN